MNNDIATGDRVTLPVLTAGNIQRVMLSFPLLNTSIDFVCCLIPHHRGLRFPRFYKDSVLNIQGSSQRNVLVSHVLPVFS